LRHETREIEYIVLRIYSRDTKPNVKEQTKNKREYKQWPLKERDRAVTTIWSLSGSKGVIGDGGKGSLCS
jgi:hypothetical protein